MIRTAIVEGGAVRGIPAADPRITAFKGIPFAAPPVGENRWRAPQPVIPWEGERLCAEFAPISMQSIPGLDPNDIYSREWNVDPEIPMDEDCLYLNVWTPAKSADERLPVFVWYFGGGLQVGNTAEMEFDGERLARRGIVVVSVNYRLNVFGFLAHPELTAQQPEAPSNFGHLDQQAGTRWVQRNIAAFGGDPNQITIGGQSAGGLSVSAQLTSPQNEGLFQGAIIDSGIFGGAYGASFPAPSFEQAQQAGAAFFEFLGVQTLAEARALDAVYIRDKANEYHAFFGTTTDGVYLTDNPVHSLMQGRRWKVPLLLSRTTDEFPSPLRAESMEQFREEARASMGSQADAFLALCGDDLESAIQTSTVSGIDIAVRALKAREEELGLKIPMYYSVFDAEIPGWDHPGTFHSVDLWFHFETLAKCWRPFTGKHYDLARQMCNYWANFVKAGNPNGPDSNGDLMPEWKPLSSAEPNSMWFGETSQPRLDTPDAMTRMQVTAYLEKVPVL